MLKRFLFLSTVCLVFGSLIFGSLSFLGPNGIGLAKDAQTSEVKLEEEKEELFATNPILDFEDGYSLDRILSFPEYIFSDYVVHISLEGKPPRHSFFYHS